MSRPPLLTEEGNIAPIFQFNHSRVRTSKDALDGVTESIWCEHAAHIRERAIGVDSQVKEDVCGVRNPAVHRDQPELVRSVNRIGWLWKRKPATAVDKGSVPVNKNVVVVILVGGGAAHFVVYFVIEG